MDRLPKRKELLFGRARKTIYLRLTTVIRSLGNKFPCTVERERVWKCIDEIGEIVNPLQLQSNKICEFVPCIIAEIKRVTLYYRHFIIGESGDGRSTKKLRAGITHLERLRDNWNDLVIDGDLKYGYRLVLKSDES